MSEPKVVIEDELLEEFSVITTLISPIEENIGVLVLGENYEKSSDNVVLRFYLLNKGMDDMYHIQLELQAFSFISINDANNFLNRLPEMSALELILSMGSNFNPVQ